VRAAGRTGRGTDLRSEYATLLLLPWPLQVRASDFRAVDGSVGRLAKDPFGFFEFAPAERLDLDLLDRVLLAARQEAGSVDVVLLPESAVEKDELDDLETVLDAHGWSCFRAGFASQCSRLGRSRTIGCTSASTRGSRRPGCCRAETASRGSTYVKTSTTRGRWMKARLISTTSAARFTPTSAGGKRWYELYQAPRSWAERAYPHNLIHFNELDRGGHFAAWEQPQLFAEEMRDAFRALR
jgi:hypothetical protein